MFLSSPQSIMSKIKENRCKSILYTYLLASVTHSQILNTDTALQSFIKDKEVILGFFWLLLGTPSSYLCAVLDTKEDETTDADETYSGHVYYVYPTAIYLSKFFDFITKKFNADKKKI